MFDEVLRFNAFGRLGTFFPGMYSRLAPQVFLVFCCAAGFVMPQAEGGQIRKAPLSFGKGWVERVLEAAILSRPSENVLFSPVQVKLDFSLLEKFGEKNQQVRIRRFFGITGRKETLEDQRKIILSFLEASMKGKGFGETYRLSFLTKILSGGIPKERFFSEEILRFLRGNLVDPDGVREAAEPEALPKAGRIAIVSETAFRSPWRYRFSAEFTAKGAFWTPSFRRGDQGRWMKVDYLRDRVPTVRKYFGNLLFQKVSIELEGGMKFILVVPREWDGLLTVLERVGRMGGIQGVEEGRPTNVDLFLPKFRIEYQNKDFLSVLQSAGLGCNPMFLQVRRDFAAMVEEYSVRSRMELDEEGISAFSRTMAELSRSAPRCAVLKADRPFLFYLVGCAGKEDPLLAGVVFRPVFSKNGSGKSGKG